MFKSTQSVVTVGVAIALIVVSGLVGFFIGNQHGGSSSNAGIMQPTGLSTKSAAQSGPDFLVNRGGPIMPYVESYAIYWLPSGQHFEPSGSDARYMSLLDRFFKDLGGSPLEEILTQYSGGDTGPPVNAASFGGSVVDTTAYPRAGTTTDPLTNDDLAMEVDHIRMQQQWPDGLQAHYFIFTASGIKTCMDPDHKSCSSSEGGYCGYHSHLDVQNGPVIFSVMPAAETGCYTPGGPNHDDLADGEISTASHELFEAASDPLSSAWFDLQGNEIGDKCNQVFGHLDSTGGNVVMNGHHYLIQQEWSNATGSCASQVKIDRGTIQIAAVNCNTGGNDLPSCQPTPDFCAQACNLNFSGTTISCDAKNVCAGSGSGSIGSKKFTFTVDSGGTIADAPCSKSQCSPGGTADLSGSATYDGKKVSFGLRASGNGNGSRIDSFTVDLGDNENYAWSCAKCVVTKEYVPLPANSQQSSSDQSSSGQSSSNQSSSDTSSSQQSSSR